MGFLDRVKHAVRLRRSPQNPPQAKTSAAGPVIAWSGVGQPKWTPRRYDNLAEEGFRKNVIAYRCVMQIATACSAVPWLLYDQSGAEVDRHPLLNLLQHPNPLQDGVSFLESVYANLEIAGNAYIEAVRPRDDQPPVELYVLRPDRMKIIPGPTGLPQGYQYTVNGQITNWPADPISGASNILHLRRFHPLDDWYGMAPMEAALLSIDQHNAAGAWNQALLGQGARPSGALVFAPKDGPATLTDDQVRRLREEMGMMYQGDRNAGRPMILEGGLDWKEMSLSPKDMDWLAGRNNAARDIALAFGVPAQMVGIPDAQTYANMSEARMAFYEETVLPLLTRVIAGFDHWLCPMYRDGVELDFDLDSISALADKRQSQWSKIQNAAFLTRNEQREAAGYGPVAGGGDGGDGDSGDSDEPSPAAAKFNPNHDELGRFTTGSGDGSEDTNTTDDGASPTQVVQGIPPEFEDLPSPLEEPTTTVKPPYDQFPTDPTQPPAPGFEWQGNGPPESGRGNWHNEDTNESLHPDLDHAPPEGPHWDYIDPNGRSWRLYPDGRTEPKIPSVLLTT
jgi:HK97 family phage portal protein